MVWIPGGRFRMGSTDFYPEEGPVRWVEVDGFWIDQYLVTVREFDRFVRETGHVTMAEVSPTAADYPDADPELLVPGSLVFRKASGPVSLADYRNWWSWTPGATWRHPEGPGSTVDGRELHPVTHVAYSDAVAFATWAGKELPTESEWELAARGGLDGAVFTWGNEFAPEGKLMANTWQGAFPWQNLLLDGYAGTSPVGAFPPNGHHLYDMAGNVWEWTQDVFTYPAGSLAKACCTTPVTADGPSSAIPRHVIKGGSHLCAPNYCMRYRPAARQGEAIDTSTCHLGFRCVSR
ncbi:formylglycine-generating enzyme family protein [Salinispora tropica]|nr:formylglycine-generating enzyme family protein [Salinispora tropica]